MKLEKILIPIDNGNLVLSGYDTEKDLKKASKDIERAFSILSDMPLYKVMRLLAPYREMHAKKSQKEYNDMVDKCLKEKN